MLYDADLPSTEEATGKTFLSLETVAFPEQKEVWAQTCLSLASVETKQYEESIIVNQSTAITDY